MKQLLLLVSLFVFTNSVFGQNLDRDRYTVSGGFLGAINANKLRIGGDNEDGIEFDTKLGWSLGGWINLPLGGGLSLEPQFMYSFYDYESLNDASDLLPSGRISYFTIPVLLKIDLHRLFAITLGPQVEFFHNLHDVREDVVEERFPSTIFGLSAGIEILPHEFITIFGRYVHGFSDIDELDLDLDGEYFNSNIQVGAKLRLFGKVIPADTDDDGIIDRDDLCPTVAGIAAFSGCPDTDSDGITDASDECPTVAGVDRYKGCPIPDTDKDGVNDEVDKCLTVAGTAKYMGCPIPDTDADGINDDDDKCPTQAGTAKYMGCPVPDTDGDGINDDNDKCPTVAGQALYDGCPPSDSDNDGVTNDKDLCPNVAGPAANFGCPVVESATFNARMINFKTGSAELTAESKRKLKEGAALMNSATFNNLVFHIHGHTDSDGSNEFNHKLSHERAASVRAELIKNGLAPDRMTSEGFGETKPIATNDTAAGKALNRRVEILARHNQGLGEGVTVPKK